jgi:hypothetical protein
MKTATMITRSFNANTNELAVTNFFVIFVILWRDVLRNQLCPERGAVPAGDPGSNNGNRKSDGDAAPLFSPFLVCKYTVCKKHTDFFCVSFAHYAFFTL